MRKMDASEGRQLRRDERGLRERRHGRLEVLRRLLPAGAQQQLDLVVRRARSGYSSHRYAILAGALV